MKTIQSMFVILMVLGLTGCNLPAKEAPTAQSLTSVSPTMTIPPTAVEPTSPPAEPTLTPVPKLSVVTEQGVSFTFDSILADTASGEVLPAVEGNDASPFWEIQPETVKFSFVNYQVDNTDHQPQILVYPVEEYIQLNPDVQPVVDELEQLLREKPDATEIEYIPSLPFWNAAQFMQANVSYLRFQNGSGVRFLTQYGQAANPINNTSLFYAFQGITDDGRYYVVAILPVGHPELPVDYESGMPEDRENFWNQFAQYIKDMEVQLSGYAGDTFIPNLFVLDAMIESLRIDK